MTRHGTRVTLESAYGSRPTTHSELRAHTIKHASTPTPETRRTQPAVVVWALLIVGSLQRCEGSLV